MPSAIDRQEIGLPPEDAGAWADGLSRILERFPPQWPRQINCRRGWYPILVRIDEQLAEYCPSYEVHQVKEKWAGLRYYFAVPAGLDLPAPIRHAMHEVVDDGEREAARTCELCGRTPAKVYVSSESYLRTVCRQCVKAGDEHGGAYRKPHQ